MKKEKNKRLRVLLILLLAISLGYALLSTVLKMNGSARFTKIDWNIYWANPQVTEGSKSMVKPTIVDDGSISNAKATWNVTFDLPGEYYEFTIDAVNAGSIDAVISSIDTTVTPTLPDYISYTLTYANGKPVEEDQVLPAASGGVSTVVTYKVRIEYLMDEVDAEFVNNMEGNISHTYNFGIQYERSTDSGSYTNPLTPQELEAKVALVEANPDLYRNKSQDPSNRDIGIDMYGNVMNLDKLTVVPSIQTNRCKPYTKQENYDVEGDYYYELGHCSNSSRGLNWATSSEYFSSGDWKLTFPAYIMADGDDQFYPVTNLGNFFSGAYNSYSNVPGKSIERIPTLPYTITYIGESFHYAGTLVGPVTVPNTVNNIYNGAFVGAFKENTPHILRLPSAYSGDTYFDDVDEIEYYD